jgi:integrase/recombinase XerD
MQFRVAVEEFLHYCAVERQLSAHTIQAYTADLSDVRKWLKSDVAVTEITTAKLKDYLQDMVARRKLAVSTVRRRFACLRALFRRIADHDRTDNPLLAWRPLLPRRKRLPRTLSRTEASFLLSERVASRPRFSESEATLRTIVRLLIVTGMRVGELCKLRLEDISPDCTTFRIHGKGARDRVAYVTDVGVRKEVSAILELRRNSASTPAALFLNRYGAPIRPQSVRSRLRRLAKEAGLERRVTPHMLRHTAATLLIETGVDIRFVQRLLGHSSIATTEIYTHVCDEALRLTLERANVLGALISH